VFCFLTSPFAEIRNPLQTILGLADLHLEQAEEQGYSALASDLGTIVRAAEFIEHIARDILDVRRVEDGKLDIELSDVDLTLLLEGLRKAVAPLQLKNPGVVFKISRDPEMMTVRTDRYRMEQILLNFLTNAYKHTAAGSVTLSLSFISMAWVRFSVIDTGCGVPHEMQEKLFQRFSQSTPRDASDLGGFGLGLYLTKKLAELLGGRVGFESTPGVGSAFWVELPAGRSDMSVSIQFDQTKMHIPANDFN
jgi:two-component system sensor histidine kinase/response regulator